MEELIVRALWSVLSEMGFLWRERVRVSSTDCRGGRYRRLRGQPRKPQ
jgi:hypothetical protein